MDSEDPGFTVTALRIDDGASVDERELGLLEAFLPELMREMLRSQEGDAEGE